MKIIRPVETMYNLKRVCVLLLLLCSYANCRPQEENLVKDNVNKVENEITIKGDENCKCLLWSNCRWSKLAVFSVKDLAKESEDFKQAMKILQKNICGDVPENHFVNCCGPDQKPSENHENDQKESEIIEPKEIVGRFFSSQQEFNENERNETLDEYDYLYYSQNNETNGNYDYDNSQYFDIRVVGGILAELNEFPWMAALVYNEKLNGEQKIACGGSLISPNVIMTAAHCIPSKNDILSNYELTKIKIGASKLSSSLIQEVDIVEISAHTGFRMSCRTCNCPCDDIALLKLSQKLQFTANIRPIGLPTADYSDEMLENTEMFDNFAVAGFGMTSASDRNSRTDDLMKLDLTFVNSGSCKRELKTRRIAPQPQPTASQICASGERFVSDSCGGDSGGPLMVKNKESNKTDKTEVIGVLSNGVAECDSSKPAVFTRVSKYLDWINAFITKADG